MQNRYVGDIGDFGKLGLLRALSSKGLSIGVNWYLTTDESHNGDGRHVDYLAKDPEKNMVTVLPAYLKLQGKEAILHGRCLAQRENTSLVSVRLETGRNHQIRVQMSHAGNPLWGDNRYGHGIPGQQIALWGYRLRFEHPTTHQILAFMSMPHGGIWTRYQDVLDRLWGEFQVESMQIPTMY